MGVEEAKLLLEGADNLGGNWTGRLKSGLSIEPAQVIVEDDAGGIAHAQLRFGNGMIMLGSARDDEFGHLQQPPSAGAVTQSPYIVVADIDDHYARAVAAGAKIAIEIKDEDYGGRVYSCRDPQGHLWNFGDYDPWQSEPSRQSRDNK